MNALARTWSFWKMLNWSRTPETKFVMKVCTDIVDLVLLQFTKEFVIDDGIKLKVC